MIKFPPPLDWFQKKLWRIRWIIDLMEAIGRIVNDLNNHIIAGFCEEKPKYDIELSTEHLVGK